MKNTQPNTGYPHIILRLIPGVYSKIKVQFTTDKPSSDSNTLSLQEPTPYEDGVLKKSVKEALIKIISEVMIPKYKLRMCLVVSPNECYYCELDGAVKPSTDVPNGKTTVKASDGPITVEYGEMLFSKYRKE
jgi:hypothetical protein